MSWRLYRSPSLDRDYWLDWTPRYTLQNDQLFSDEVLCKKLWDFIPLGWPNQGGRMGPMCRTLPWECRQIPNFDAEFSTSDTISETWARKRVAHHLKEERCEVVDEGTNGSERCPTAGPCEKVMQLQVSGEGGKHFYGLSDYQISKNTLLHEVSEVLWLKVSEKQDMSCVTFRKMLFIFMKDCFQKFASLKRRSTSTRLHGAIFRKAVIFILAAVRTWNFTCCFLFRWGVYNHLSKFQVGESPLVGRPQLQLCSVCATSILHP
jgi:hypothetical protein